MKVPQKVPRVEYNKILYATDLSETGRFAFPYAASIANRYNAKLTVFHVVETVEFEKYVVGYISEDLWNEIKTRDLKEAKDLLTSRKRDDAAIKEALDQLRQEAVGEDEEKPYVTYDVVVKTGDPVEEIVKEADEGNYDLVVIGEHSGKGIGSALKRKVGSTAWRVLHRCKRPILVVRLPARQE
jgi:nucleotide-binding universal stress UspA family protein